MESTLSLVSSKPYPYPLILLGGIIHLQGLRSYIWSLDLEAFGTLSINLGC